MKVVKVINKQKTLKGKNGKDFYSSYFVIVCDNGKAIPIKPMFNNGYPSLEFIATDVKVIKEK